jgi:hypothetical protein
MFCSRLICQKVQAISRKLFMNRLSTLTTIMGELVEVCRIAVRSAVSNFYNRSREASIKIGAYNLDQIVAKRQ